MLTACRASAFRSAGLILLRSSAEEGFKLGLDGSVEGLGDSLDLLEVLGELEGVLFDGIGDWSFIDGELNHVSKMLVKLGSSLSFFSGGRYPCSAGT
jgi:hypothetical protein